ncbi:MAG: hypothetical protein P4L31_08825 [Candidatus Babeliales bacterium]|nr:hypothetical protein [Candidatus Babeliales bacterium]
MKISRLLFLISFAGLLVMQQINASVADVTQKVQSLIDKGFTVNNATLGVAPAPAIVKQLDIMYIPKIKTLFGRAISQKSSVQAFDENSQVPAGLGIVISAIYHPKGQQVITVANLSDWSTDGGVFLQCGFNTAVNKVAGNLAPHSGLVLAAYPPCPIPATIYIYTAGQFFTFSNIMAGQGLAITNINGRISVNGNPYGKSGDQTIPGLNAPLTSLDVLQGFKDALHAIAVNLTVLSNAPAAQRLTKLMSLQNNTANQVGLPTLGLQLANFAHTAPTQLKGTLPDSLMPGLVSLMTHLSKALAAVSLSPQAIAALQSNANTSANTALKNAINALIPFAEQAAALEKVFDGLIDAYKSSLPKLESSQCLNLLV